jgi:predicted N-acetyltransferase YhbS
MAWTGTRHDPYAQIGRGHEKGENKMIIRSEYVTDYAAIGALHVRAFGNRTAEASIVARLRQRRAFDPELSLVAEIEGCVVGHALFSPYRMCLLGETVPAVNLAPMAVDPAYQGRGIGARLITEGHVLAAAKGYVVSILLGHSSYYPRFGYQTHAFGSAQVATPIDEYPQDMLDVHDPTDKDVAMLNALWLHEEGAVDMALEPGPDLLDWLSPDPAVQAAVYTRGSEVVGYTRTSGKELTRPLVFLVRDHEAARAIVATMAHQSGAGASGTEYRLPLHPFSASAGAFGHATCSARETCMACTLGSGSLDEYLTRVRRGERPPGRVIWPVAFDLN